MSYICAFCDDEFSDNVMCPECVAALRERAEKAERERDAKERDLNYYRTTAPMPRDVQRLEAEVSRLTAERDARDLRIAEAVLTECEHQSGHCTNGCWNRITSLDLTTIIRGVS